MAVHMKFRKYIETNTRNTLLFFGFLSFVTIEARTTINNPHAGGLEKVLSQAQIDTCTEVVLTGKLNSADIRLLRRMAGYAEYDDEKTGRLCYLDLSEVTFVSDKNPYLTVDAEKENLCFFQKPYGTSPLTDHVGKASAKNGPVGAVTLSGYEGGDAWIYMKNFAILNYTGDEIYLPGATNHRVSNSKRNGIVFQSMRHIKGHHLRKVNGQWQWSSYIRKGRFCVDMFYGCKNLKILIIPGSVKCCSRVSIYKDGIKYFFR